MKKTIIITEEQLRYIIKENKVPETTENIDQNLKTVVDKYAENPNDDLLANVLEYLFQGKKNDDNTQNATIKCMRNTKFKKLVKERDYNAIRNYATRAYKNATKDQHRKEQKVINVSYDDGRKTNGENSYDSIFYTDNTTDSENLNLEVENYLDFLLKNKYSPVTSEKSRRYLELYKYLVCNTSFSTLPLKKQIAVILDWTNNENETILTNMNMNKLEKIHSRLFGSPRSNTQITNIRGDYYRAVYQKWLEYQSKDIDLRQFESALKQLTKEHGQLNDTQRTKTARLLKYAIEKLTTYHSVTDSPDIIRGTITHIKNNVLQNLGYSTDFINNNTNEPMTNDEFQIFKNNLAIAIGEKYNLSFDDTKTLFPQTKSRKNR